jgi:hypothetical protein
LETLVVEVIERVGGDESGALQAGGRRFEPCHVHQHNSRTFRNLRCHFHFILFTRFRYIHEIDRMKACPAICFRISCSVTVFLEANLNRRVKGGNRKAA